MADGQWPARIFFFLGSASVVDVIGINSGAHQLESVDKVSKICGSAVRIQLEDHVKYQIPL